MLLQLSLFLRLNIMTLFVKSFFNKIFLFIFVNENDRHEMNYKIVYLVVNYHFIYNIYSILKFEKVKEINFDETSFDLN